MNLGNIESVTLTKLPVSISGTLDDYPAVRHGLNVEQIIDPMFRGMLYRIKTSILAEEIDISDLGFWGAYKELL